ncbi:reverse transcriptase domain-containing protein [Clostridium perfringens]
MKRSTIETWCTFLKELDRIGQKLELFTFYINKRKPHQRAKNRPPNWDKVRQISCYPKEVNKVLRRLNSELLTKFDNLLHKDQYGFRRGRSILDLKKVEGNQAICIDLKDAFHNLRLKRVQRIYGRIFPKTIAVKLAKSLCPNGYMFQGHPIAPFTLNLAMVESLKNLEHWDLKGFHYADDLNFIFEGKPKTELYALTKIILKTLKSQGFTVNKRKIHVFPKRFNTLGLTKEYRISYNTGGYVVTPRRKLREKVRMLAHWLKIGRYHTGRKSKDGRPIKTQEVLDGLLAYLNNFRDLQGISIGNKTYYKTQKFS